MANADGTIKRIGPSQEVGNLTLQSAPFAAVQIKIRSVDWLTW
jgi:hypothetical protein